MDHIQPGQMLGPYRIIGQIGQGGMATVYKAYQPSMDRNVAIKVLPMQLASSPEFVQRFQQEARIIAKLEHPHILPVFDYGESDGTAYFVMRYLDAGTLKEKMEKERPLSLNEIDRIFTQLTDALSYAHGRGVVHRDLKPANALIDSQGNLFLTDFGIAKILESASTRLTQTDAIMGTPAYISPEQAQSRPVDQRSDIYSLGIILYEMVTGSVPFVADTPLAIILKHVSDPLPLPTRVKPDVSAAIEQVILKALAKEPNDRFATAAEFVAAWKKALAQNETSRHVPEPAPTVLVPSEAPGKQPAAKPVPLAKPAPKPAPKSGISTGWIVGCLAVACVGLSALGIGVLAMNGQGLSLFTSATETAVPTSTVFVPAATDTPLPLPTHTASPQNNTGDLILEDDFAVTHDRWGTLDGEKSSVQYDSSSLRMKLFEKNYVVWSRPNDENYRDIHAEITVINNGTDSTTAFGILCGQQNEDWSFYYLAVTPAGEYAIIKATDGQDDVYLTNDGSWGSSDQIAVNADQYRVSADCGHGTLTLYVNGHRIDSVSDTTYPTGHVGLFAWSGEEASSADVSFDDFVLSSLK